ncbi:hypothetical protein ABTX77_32610 [Streptomyces sp. NPDC097704]|uniref:hypothetical protein n=1 Tax=Streptomyces sp. NPDC097704 TaxID=3157101 RepID=UPI0033268E70
MKQTEAAGPAVLVVQHEEDAGLGLVGEHLERDGLRLDVIRAGRGEALPETLGGHAGLVVLGGSINCEDEVDRLPAGAVPLPAGDDCPYQAFRVGSAGWAVQFHPEAGADTVAAWAAGDGGPLGPAGGDPAGAMASVREAEPELRAVRGAVSDAWGGVVRAHAHARGI